MPSSMPRLLLCSPRASPLFEPLHCGTPTRWLCAVHPETLALALHDRTRHSNLALLIDTTYAVLSSSLARLIHSLSAFAAFGASVHKHHGHPSLWSKIFVLLALIFLESTAAAYAFSSREGDPAGAAVIAFALFGIFIHQRPASGFVGWTAFAAFVLSLFAIAKSAWGTVRSRNGGAGIAAGDEERQSLLSAAS